MKLQNLSLSNCREIEYEYTKDYNRFGNRRYSWFFMRDKGIEDVLNYLYLVNDDACPPIFGEDNTFVLTCLKGAYSVRVKNVSGGAATYNLTALSNNLIHIVSPQNIEVTSQAQGSQLMIISKEKMNLLLPMEEDTEEQPLHFVTKQEASVTEVKPAVFKCSTKGIVEIEDYDANGIHPIYNANLFSAHGVEPEFTFINHDTMRFANSFRGLYMQVGARGYASMVRCVSGSAIVYAIDMRPFSETYKQNFSFRLDTPEKAVFFEKGFALGYYSVEDNTAIITHTNGVFDKKYQRTINLTECADTSTLDLDTLIISALDRFADKLGEGANIDLI